MNEVNPPKKNSPTQFPKYLVIYLEDATTEVAFEGRGTLPSSCADVPWVDPTTEATGDLQIR